METYDAVILASGDFPVAKEALSILHSAKFLCCCDSAAEIALQHGLTPDVVVGDGDSLNDDSRARLGERYIQIDEQEDNDLTKATRHCIGLGYKHIAYIGATGKREDHTIGNIFLLPKYHKDFGIVPTMYTNYGVFTVGEGDREYTSFARQQVSIFNISCERLTSENLKWALYPAPSFWETTLNEALGETFSIQSDGIYIVFQTYAPKEDRTR